MMLMSSRQYLERFRRAENIGEPRAAMHGMHFSYRPGRYGAMGLYGARRPPDRGGSGAQPAVT